MLLALAFAAAVSTQPTICAPRSGSYVLENNYKTAVCVKGACNMEAVKDFPKTQNISGDALDNPFNKNGVEQVDNGFLSVSIQDNNWCDFKSLLMGPDARKGTELTFDTKGNSGVGNAFFIDTKGEWMVRWDIKVKKVVDATQ